MMMYISTRGWEGKVDSAQAIINGLADDGGLFVPETIPQAEGDFIASLAGLTYEERAVKVLEYFLTDYGSQELAGCVDRAYGAGKFDAVPAAPLHCFADSAVLELWHGPTSAFKDMALQLLPQLLTSALRKKKEKDNILILVATSGDTGKAALEGFKDVSQTKIMVFYPESGVSRIQRRQMVTQKGDNVSVIAVKGNFDDAQSGVKNIFCDKAFADKLQAAGVRLSSANSINWGRLVPQIVYYFSAYADLLQAGHIKMGDKVNFSVPTGNFGDILAGFYAKQMGLPIGRLICASNKNNVLTDFINTGVYDRNRDFYKTITPSMDILISSNLERLLYHITGDTSKVRGWMEELAATGRYEIDATSLQTIKQLFWAEWTNEPETFATIKSVKAAKNYVIDPHTAVAWKAAENYRVKTGDRNQMVIVSTASPYKFNDSVLQALDLPTAGMDEFQQLAALAEVNKVSIPQGLASLEMAAVRHDKIVAKEDMQKAVNSFIADF